MPADVIEAARSLFLEAGFRDSSMGAIAARAGVSRATVYYQFKSKRGLLETVIDDALARGGPGPRPPTTLPSHLQDPHDLLAGFLEKAARVWEADRLFLRRVIGLGEVDPTVSEVIRSRDRPRLKAARFVADGLRNRYGARKTAAALGALSGFPTFSAIRREASFEETVKILRSMTEGLIDPDNHAKQSKSPGKADGVTTPNPVAQAL